MYWHTDNSTEMLSSNTIQKWKKEVEKWSINVIWDPVQGETEVLHP